MAVYNLWELLGTSVLLQLNLVEEDLTVSSLFQ